MQILRQAIFDKINEKVLKFKVFRSKIIYLTTRELIVSTVQLSSKKQFVQINGSEVKSIQIHKDFIGILFASSKLEIRKLQILKQVVCTYQNIQIEKGPYPISKWWNDELYLIYQNKYKKCCIYSKSIQSFQIKKSLSDQKLIGVQFSDLFPQVTNIIYHFKNKIVIYLNQLQIAQLSFEQGITQIIKLCHPLQEGSYNKQYLIVVQQNKKLKVFNMITMKLIFQKKFNGQKNQTLSLQVDDLSQYLIIKNINIHSQKIEQVTLLKVNKQYYFSHQYSYDAQQENFFLFQISLGLKQDFHLFPSHSQIIKETLCDSIDMCYLKQPNIFIASVVTKANFKNQIYQNKIKFKSKRSELSIWKDIVVSKINPGQILNKIIKQVQQKNQFENVQYNFNIQHDLIVYAILKNLQKFNDFQNFDQDAFQTIKKAVYVYYFPMLLNVDSIQEQESRISKQIMEKSNQDYLNTMSGLSSSYQCNNSDYQKFQSKQEEQFTTIKEETKNKKSYNSQNEANNQQLFFINQNQLSQLTDISFCNECQSLTDQNNLDFIQNIFTLKSEKLFQNSFKKIQNKLFLMQKNHKFKLGEIQRKIVKEKKQQKKLNSEILFKFEILMQNVKEKVQQSINKFSQLVNQKPNIQKSYSQYDSQIKKHLKRKNCKYKFNQQNFANIRKISQNIQLQQKKIANSYITQQQNEDKKQFAHYFKKK